MKKLFFKILSLSIIAVSICGITGCDGETFSSQAETAATTQAQTSAVETTVPTVPEDFDIASLHYYDEESSDPFAGAWHITGGAGSALESFTYIFDGNGNASLVVGNMGYCSTYGTALEDSTETFTCQLMYGINGTYTFKFDESGNSVTLTNVADNNETILEKRENFSYTPEKPENPKLDEKLIGAWKSEEGMYYYFGEDGIMYCNSFGAMFTYFSYSAENGMVEATYTMSEETVESYEYSFDGEKLTFDGLVYTKIPATELI